MHDLVEATGPIPCMGMIIGEAPGREEQKQGVAFAGPSGRLLNEALAEAGSSRDEVYVTNSYKLRPPGNRNPSPQELELHRPLFHKELSRVGPEVILALGRVAFEYVTIVSDKVPMAEARVREWSAYGRIVLVSWHPAYVLRNARAREDFFEDVAHFVNEMKVRENV